MKDFQVIVVFTVDDPKAPEINASHNTKLQIPEMFTVHTEKC